MFYLKSKQFLLCLMSKRFRKHRRDNMTQLHLGDFQPVFLAAEGAAAPRRLPGCPGVAEGMGGCPRSGAKGKSREGETLIRMEPLNLTHVQPQRG